MIGNQAGFLPRFDRATSQDTPNAYVILSSAAYLAYAIALIVDQAG